jgi:hypothetical protein
MPRLDSHCPLADQAAAGLRVAQAHFEIGDKRRRRLRQSDLYQLGNFLRGDGIEAVGEACGTTARPAAAIATS